MEKRRWWRGAAVVVEGWRKRAAEEGVKEEEKTSLVGLEVGFGREGGVERHVGLVTAAAAAVAAAEVIEAMAEAVVREKCGLGLGEEERIW